MTIPITEPPVIFGMLCLLLGLIFAAYNSGHPALRTFCRYVPALLLCYLLPSLLVNFGLIAAGGGLWPIARDYFLPASLVLMTLSTDIKGIIGLGHKALIMFFTATVGIILGGPLAVFVVAQLSPATVGGEGADAIWRGLATLAGSWIGGGANQTAMLEVYGFNPQRYAPLVAVDILMANLWLAFLLYVAGDPRRMDKWLRADTSAIEHLQERMATYSQSVAKHSELPDFMLMLGIAFGGTGAAHLLGGLMVQAVAGTALAGSILASKFFWVVVLATAIGLACSFTRLRALEGSGASRLGSLFIYLLVAVIGTRMDIVQVLQTPALMLVGAIWMLFHIALIMGMARIIRAPFFFVATGSLANVGGAASAPVVAAAFHPSLAPVGVLLAVLGYALGTYGAIVCAELMRLVAP